MSTPAGCPRCYWVVESSEMVCEASCEGPACEPCAKERWRAAHPIEAAIEDAEDADADAQIAEEQGDEDWRHYAAIARAAWAHVDYLQEGETRDGQ